METKTKTKLAVFIPAQAGTPKIVDLLNGEHGDVLATMQFAVQGYIQPVDLAQEWEGFTLTSNEEAKLISGMPFNPIATQIWAESFAGFVWGGDDYILGNAIMTLGVDEEGEFMGMTQEQADQLVTKLLMHYIL
jgi:hypothetical protein